MYASVALYLRKKEWKGQMIRVVGGQGGHMMYLAGLPPKGLEHDMLYPVLSSVWILPCLRHLFIPLPGGASCTLTQL